eukprot:scaffold42079_cov60-Phaeocystis_antarctica.AAC.1
MSLRLRVCRLAGCVATCQASAVRRPTKSSVANSMSTTASELTVRAAAESCCMMRLVHELGKLCASSDGRPRTKACSAAYLIARIVRISAESRPIRQLTSNLGRSRASPACAMRGAEGAAPWK